MATILKEFLVKNSKLRNRIVLPPMASGKSSEEGKVTNDLKAYYQEKTKNKDLGLVILEHSYVSIEGKSNFNQLSIDDDSKIEGLKELCDVIHRNGSLILCQLAHAGGKTHSKITNRLPLAPSSLLIPNSKNKDELPKELTKEEIDELVVKFKEASKRAISAGFDGVEIHSAHGYLLNEFLSPLTNKREDEYGYKSLENRLLIHKRIIEEIKKIAPKDFIVAIRIGAFDYMEGGTSLSDLEGISKILEKSKVDLIDISGGLCTYINPLDNSNGYFKKLAKVVKSNCDVPVILTGGITSLNEANKLIEEGYCDLVGIGRAILKNSNFIKEHLNELD